MTIKSEIKLTNYTAYKYDMPYTGPFVITQCFTNDMVNLKCGAIQINHNIRRIKPYKLDTKFEDFNLINMNDPVNI